MTNGIWMYFVTCDQRAELVGEASVCFEKNRWSGEAGASIFKFSQGRSESQVCETEKEATLGAFWIFMVSLCFISGTRQVKSAVYSQMVF